MCHIATKQWEKTLHLKIAPLRSQLGDFRTAAGVFSWQKTLWWTGAHKCTDMKVKTRFSHLTIGKQQEVYLLKCECILFTLICQCFSVFHFI